MLRIRSTLSRRAFLSGTCALASAMAARRLSVPLGLELYSLRLEAEKDLPAALSLTRKLGFTELEGGDFFGRSAAEFRKLLNGHGLRMTSMMAPFDRLNRNVDSVADDARALGAQYVVCSTVPHQRKLSLED